MGDRRAFAHPSEEEVARIFDYYRVRYEYEPRSFPIVWDDDGRIAESFTPDFYLPDYDLYVEVTVLKQSLVTRKNRKVRLLRALYPHVNVKLLYNRDVRALFAKYGVAPDV
ncbi:MAG: hypothetical protein KGM44_10260 [bacterium]|nr:hypothetical protein [bacterium]